jgi:hypothetical protein
MIRNNKLTKKEREMIVLKDFISNSPLSFEIIEINESDPPDFIIKLSNKTNGIELTELINENFREREMLLEKIVDDACDIFKAKYSSRLSVSVEFIKPKIRLNWNQAKNVSENLFRTIEETYLKNKEPDFDICLNMENCIKKIQVSNKASFENWHVLGAFKLSQMDMGLLNGIIAKKENHIKNYTYEFDEKWLLIISNYGFKSDTYDFNSFKSIEIKSEFDKIYLFKYIEGEIIELR